MGEWQGRGARAGVEVEGGGAPDARATEWRSKPAECQREGRQRRRQGGKED